MLFTTGVATPSGAHGQGTAMGPKPMGSFWLGPLDPWGPWTLSILSIRLLRRCYLHLLISFFMKSKRVV